MNITTFTVYYFHLLRFAKMIIMNENLNFSFHYLTTISYCHIIRYCCIKCIGFMEGFDKLFENNFINS